MTLSVLDELFPAVNRGRNFTRDAHFTNHPEDAGRPSGTERADAISTRWAAICTLELQGRTHADIAQRVGMSVQGVSSATRHPRYKAYRDARLAELDDEFFAMKPLALDALRGGLKSNDENTALRASEQWFKAASFGGFSKTEAPPQTATAEDVARALMLGVQVNVSVNTDAAGKSKNVELSEARHDEPQREALKSDEPPGTRTEGEQLPLPLAGAGVE